MSHGTLPIPRWLGDPDYYGRRDPRREGHRKHIETQRRINARIDASAGDGSYSVVISRRDTQE